MAANSGVIAGGQRKHNETTTSQSVITGNISVNAGSVQGQYTTDLANANGHLDNKFNAEKLSNQLKNSQVGMQLVGEVMGQVSDALDDHHVWGFDETNTKNDIGRIILEGAGSAAVAGITGGNIGSATASSVGGNLATSASLSTVYNWALKQSNGDQSVALALTNSIENAVAMAGGAAAGGVFGGTSGVVNGTGVSSSLQGYNQAAGNKFLLQGAGYAVVAGAAASSNNQDLGDAVYAAIAAVDKNLSNYFDYTQQANNTVLGAVYMFEGIGYMAEHASDYTNALKNAASQYGNQLGQYADALSQLGGQIYQSITLNPDASKPFILATPANPSNNIVSTGHDVPDVSGLLTIPGTTIVDLSGLTTLPGFTIDPNTGNMTIYVESQGYDPRLPIPEVTTASNGLKVESNPKHTPGAPGFRSDAGIEPKNSLELFGNSVSIDGNKARYSMDSDGSIHRYLPDNTGSYHWSGSTSDSRNPLILDNTVKAQLRKQEGWKIK